ncbi:MAG: dihydropteroate synthase [Clostridiales bacterium]|nr:dihydropteroate synthase [Clostridiales bacterium]
MYNLREIKVRNSREAKYIIQRVGTDAAGINLMAPKAVHRLLFLEDVPVKIALILKQEMLAVGGDAAVARGVVSHEVEESNVLLMGTLKQYKNLVKKLHMQPFKLPKLAEDINTVLNNCEYKEPYEIPCGNYSLSFGERTLVMGILNVTPDSFSDGGKFNDPDIAIKRAKEMVEQGADIIDIGAESTRPGHTPVSAEEEIERLQPIIRELVKEINVPISVDTYKAKTAEMALKAGAHIINDVWGFQKDPEIAAVVSQYGAPAILMHNQEGTEYKDLMGDIIKFLRKSINIAVKAGLPEDKIIIDPGIGFGKDTEQNLEVMARLDEFCCLGRPILLGTSRKSLIGNTLNLPVNERLEGTAATVTLGIAKGVDIVRVHDVEEIVRVVRMTDAMVRR